MDTERQKRLYAEKRKWIYGKILMEDGICLIENEEGDLLLVESLNRPGRRMAKSRTV